MNADYRSQRVGHIRQMLAGSSDVAYHYAGSLG